jgi:predicted phage baseplate assembly protein
VLSQDPRSAVPQVGLFDGTTAWTARQDLLASGPTDPDFVVEIDNSGIAHLRFGDGLLGRSPTVDRSFTAVYRNGRGTAGNVGAESISHLVLDDMTIDGISVTVRNPLPAHGGVDPEPIAEAKLLAPRGFRQTIERAIIADDYARIAERNAGLQRASAQLVWTGSWYESDVAIDPLGREMADPTTLQLIEGILYRYRRMGHDLRVQAAVYVPITLRLKICVLPGYDRGHVKAALISRFSNRVNSDGSTGFFHPDALSFGENVYLSRIIAAAQSVVGVEFATVVAFHRCLEEPNQEIANGVLPLASNEIAQLDNDPDHPERGGLEIVMRGGR